MRTHAHYIPLCLALVIVTCWAGTNATAAFDTIRVYELRPACFEYKFTSVVSDSGGQPVLSLNHISGQTFFARVGDTIGEYTIKAFEPKTERVFNPSINAYQKKDCGKVTLEDSDGKSIILERDELLPRPGWMACLVSIATGNWCHVGDKDIIILDNTKMTINTISLDSVTVSIEGVQYTVPVISESEKENLSLLWEERHKQRAEELKLAMKSREAKQEQQVVSEVSRPRFRLRRTIEIRYPPRFFFFGTEYRYPVEFQAFPLVSGSDSGTIIRGQVIIPTRFETRTSGIEVRCR